MRPVLMLENVKSLHDARYCAAVGIGMVSFDVDPDSINSVPLSAAVEIAQWLMGVNCVAKLGSTAAPSYEALAANEAFSQVLLPFSAYSGSDRQNIILEIAIDDLDDALFGKLHAIVASNPDSLFLLPSDAGVFAGLSNDPLVFQHCIFRLDQPSNFLQRMAIAVPYGFAFGAFAFEADGQLDYDACDQFIDTYNGVIPDESLV